LAVAALLFIGTAMLVALCIPGVIVPMAASATALLGGWEAVPVVALGAVAGSQLLFAGVRRAGSGETRVRLGRRLPTIERRFAAHGLWYVVGLRVCGAPHFLVTGASALLPIGALAFAGATLAGFLPSIAIAAAAVLRL
jgi:uncharacterized membrane protein YdjX (TVP38/TMEM64 family)